MTSETNYPDSWLIAQDYDPNAHLMSLKGRTYLDVQNRLIWFVRDQRDFIARGLASTSYCIRTELVEQDAERGFAQFKTYVRDVLGNEATMYGSETAKDFADYAEKASTKSLGRALAMLGYGTQFAPEMDEGDRVVDTPVERRAAPAAAAAAPAAVDDEPATPEQQERMRRYREALGISEKAIAVTDNRLRYNAAETRIAEYIRQWKHTKQLQEVR